MFEQSFHTCPACGVEIRQRLEDEDEFLCGSCGRRFRILHDTASGKTGLIDVSREEIPEPLYLPKGSIRAGVTVLLSLASWILILRAVPVPAYLFGLLLTMIGYYFGFRKKLKAAQSRILDAAAHAAAPLFLPANVIRVLLIMGFFAAGLVLLVRRQLTEMRNLEFFVVFFGLVVGYLFAKLSGRLKTTAFFVLLNHAKGLLVIVAALTLTVLLLTDLQAGRAYLNLGLAATVSFYFGSRS